MKSSQETKSVPHCHLLPLTSSSPQPPPPPSDIIVEVTLLMGTSLMLQSSGVKEKMEKVVKVDSEEQHIGRRKGRAVDEGEWRPII